MKEFFIISRGVLTLVGLVMIAGFTAGVAYGILERLFKFGLGLVT